VCHIKVAMGDPRDCLPILRVALLGHEVSCSIEMCDRAARRRRRHAAPVRVRLPSVRVITRVIMRRAHVIVCHARASSRAARVIALGHRCSAESKSEW
jgi:hypothetical protein